MFKKCFKCLKIKTITSFHVHKQMKDGRLGKCSSCVIADVHAWKRKQREETGISPRVKSYASELARGKRTRLRAVKINGIPIGVDPIKKKISHLKYAHKRRLQIPSIMDELTDLAFKEATALCILREKITNSKWALDHIVPLNHKKACGLHVAANFQVVPDKWNYSKGNRHMKRYFGELNEEIGY